LAQFCATLTQFVSGWQKVLPTRNHQLFIEFSFARKPLI
jgi:hypothetical protein